MKTISILEAQDQLGELIARVYRGETVVLADGDRRVTLEPSGALDLEEDSPELEAELLKAANGPFSPWDPQEFREIADKALREYRAKQQK